MVHGMPSRNSRVHSPAVRRSFRFLNRCGNSSVNALVIVSNMPNYKYSGHNALLQATTTRQGTSDCLRWGYIGKTVQLSFKHGKCWLTGFIVFGLLTLYQRSPQFGIGLDSGAKWCDLLSMWSTAFCLLICSPFWVHNTRVETMWGLLVWTIMCSY